METASTRVEQALDEWVRPVLEADGGGIELVSVEGATVQIRLTDACAGCPGAAYTLRRVVMPVLADAVEGPLHVDVIRVPPLPNR